MDRRRARSPGARRQRQSRREPGTQRSRDGKSPSRGRASQGAKGRPEIGRQTTGLHRRPTRAPRYSPRTCSMHSRLVLHHAPKSTGAGPPLRRRQKTTPKALVFMTTLLGVSKKGMLVSMYTTESMAGTGSGMELGVRSESRKWGRSRGWAHRWTCSRRSRSGMAGVRVS